MKHWATLICLTGLLVSTITGAQTQQYQIVPIDGIANWSLSDFYQSPPTGSLVFNGVPFYISPQAPNVFFTQDGGIGSENPTTGSLTGILGTANIVYSSNHRNGYAWSLWSTNG